MGILFWGPQEYAWKYLRPGLLEGIREAGLSEGPELVLEWRFSNGDAARDRSLAVDLVASGCEVVVTAANERVNALLAASATLPVVALVRDPVESGFARSLRDPGGRVTGLVSTSDAQTAKQVEVMRVLFPQVNHLTILIGTEDHDPKVRSAPFERGAQDAGMRVEMRVVDGLEGFRAAFREIRARGGAGFVASFPPRVDAKLLAQAAIAERVPTMTIHRAFVEQGGLMGSYPTPYEVARRLGAVAGRIVRGAAARDIPLEYPTRNDLVLNGKTATALGIEIPRAIRLQATEIFAA